MHFGRVILAVENAIDNRPEAGNLVVTGLSVGSALRSAANQIFVCFLLCFCVLAGAQPAWFTIVGNPADSQTDVVEVDPQSRSFNAGNSTLNVRVSRSVLRTSSDGIPFRSYTATVLVDCATKSARFVTANFYMMPLWEGRPHASLAFSAAEVRPLLFRNIEPNPAGRIIRAACQTPTQ